MKLFYQEANKGEREMQGKVVTVIMAGLGSLVGLGIGALLRQPEINRLKKEIKHLQEELPGKIENIENELNRQIDELHKRYTALKLWQFIEKKKQKGLMLEKNKEIFIFRCFCKEGIELLGKGIAEKKEKQVLLANQEREFLDNFTDLLDGKAISEDVMDKINDYLLTKYSYDVSGEIKFDYEKLIEENLTILIR
ncbi:MAG: hypothetical protein LBQ46_05070 [Treponema sp.]|nr:hypothetical protein [Treponema sp.]